MVNTRPLKNLWVAASDGDIERVKVSPSMTKQGHSDLFAGISCHRGYDYKKLFKPRLTIDPGYNANSPDENSYTPM